MNDELKDEAPRRKWMRYSKAQNKFGNLLSNLPDQIDDEILETIINSEGCKTKRIISKGHHSPDNYWYDQEKNEWVMVLKV
jgi:cupin 2 domain-containing protein